MAKESAEKAFSMAQDRYAELGVDVQKALKTLSNISLSVHCWQADDVSGFETPDSELSGGGIQVTGSYPGKAGTIRELQADLEKVYSLIPGSHRLNLHAIYGDFKGKYIERDQIGPEHFKFWCEWAEKNRIKLDFNATCFSHPLADSGYTLSSKDEKTRRFWIRHVQKCRRISAYMGEQQDAPCIHNLWIPDGAKDITIDRYGHRALLKESLDEIYSDDLDSGFIKDAVEAKLFGIGSEAFVVGSHEFYLGYALSRGKMICLDMGHFHPTESVADKVSALFLFTDEILFHISRPVRWDSDHVVILNDDVRSLFEELVRCGKLDCSHLGLDFFDATMNRVGAMTIGARGALKALLLALLEPRTTLMEYEEHGDFFARLALLEELKILPFGAVWDYYCRTKGAPVEREIIGLVQQYDNEVTGKRP